MGKIQRVILAVGLPGAGKSTWLKQAGVVPLASDHLRLLLSGNEDNQSIHTEVFDTMRYLLERRIEIGMETSYLDATFLLAAHRKPFVDLAAERGCAAEALWFDTALDVCLERNRRRDRQVPEDIIRAMAEAMEPPTKDEGFGTVTRITGND